MSFLSQAGQSSAYYQCPFLAIENAAVGVDALGLLVMTLQIDSNALGDAAVPRMTSSPNIRSRRRPRCSGTVEDHRGLAFDVRDRALRNSGLLDLPPGYVLRNAIA